LTSSEERKAQRAASEYLKAKWLYKIAETPEAKKRATQKMKAAESKLSSYASKIEGKPITSIKVKPTMEGSLRPSSIQYSIKTQPKQVEQKIQPPHGVTTPKPQPQTTSAYESYLSKTNPYTGLYKQSFAPKSEAQAQMQREVAFAKYKTHALRFKESQSRAKQAEAKLVSSREVTPTQLNQRIAEYNREVERANREAQAANLFVPQVNEAEKRRVAFANKRLREKTVKQFGEALSAYEKKEGVGAAKVARKRALSPKGLGESFIKDVVVPTTVIGTPGMIALGPEVPIGIGTASTGAWVGSSIFKGVEAARPGTFVSYGTDLYWPAFPEGKEQLAMSSKMTVLPPSKSPVPAITSRPVPASSHKGVEFIAPRITPRSTAEEGLSIAGLYGGIAGGVVGVAAANKMLSASVTTTKAKARYKVEEIGKGKGFDYLKYSGVRQETQNIHKIVGSTSKTKNIKVIGEIRSKDLFKIPKGSKSTLKITQYGAKELQFRETGVTTGRPYEANVVLGLEKAKVGTSGSVALKEVRPGYAKMGINEPQIKYASNMIQVKEKGMGVSYGYQKRGLFNWNFFKEDFAIAGKGGSGSVGGANSVQKVMQKFSAKPPSFSQVGTVQKSAQFTKMTFTLPKGGKTKTKTIPLSRMTKSATMTGAMLTGVKMAMMPQPKQIQKQRSFMRFAPVPALGVSTQTRQVSETTVKQVHLLKKGRSTKNWLMSPLATGLSPIKTTHTKTTMFQLQLQPQKTKIKEIQGTKTTGLLGVVPFSSTPTKRFTPVPFIPLAPPVNPPLPTGSSKSRKGRGWFTGLARSFKYKPSIMGMVGGFKTSKKPISTGFGIRPLMNTKKKRRKKKNVKHKKTKRKRKHTR